MLTPAHTHLFSDQHPTHAHLLANWISRSMRVRWMIGNGLGGGSRIIEEGERVTDIRSVNTFAHLVSVNADMP